MSDPIALTGITWNHTRGYLPMVATAQRFGELHPGVAIVWQKRSLQEFADYPIERLAERFDLLIIDHPFAGQAAEQRVLLPLDEHLPAEFLADQATGSAGLTRNPIATYEVMAATDDIVYCPFAYGYSNYARRGYARHTLRFGGLVSFAGQPLRSTLGGTGLAISAHCRHVEQAVAYARFV